jgi:hypothetical protein
MNVFSREFPPASIQNTIVRNPAPRDLVPSLPKAKEQHRVKIDS